jgi:hypothetical protein
MDKAQLPVLMSIMMITQAVLSTPCGLRAKRSLKERNHLLLAGFGAMMVADLLFAKLGTPQGDLLHGMLRPCSVLQDLVIIIYRRSS